MTEVHDTIAGIRMRLAGSRGDLGSMTPPRPPQAAESRSSYDVALVATMGALHDGHLALVRRAHELAETVVVSIFVNPLQFSAGEDLDRYPRNLEADLAALPEGTIVFAPAVAELYPDGDSETRVTAGAVGSLYEGASRPGHFDGMLTVVAKLMNIVQPDVVLFGQKDAQQVFLVQRMVRDLNMPIHVEVVETVREAGGLALSSRNAYLSEADKAAALALSMALTAARAAAAGGRDAALAEARDILVGEPSVEVDYLDLVDPSTFTAVDSAYRGPALAVIAARVGGTRLIDNTALQLGAAL